MVSKIFRCLSLTILATMSFATTPYWFARYSVGGISYAGGNIYVGTEYNNDAVDNNPRAIREFNYVPSLNSYESMVTDDSDWGTIYGISTDSTGTGYVATQDGNIDYIENGKFVRRAMSETIDYVTGVSYTGNALYYVTQQKLGSSALYRCDVNNGFIDDCQSLGILNNYGLGVSFDANGDGFVIANDNRLYLYKHDTLVGHVHTFDDSPMGVSYPGGDSVYVATEGHSGSHYVHKCIDDGTNTNTWHCKELDNPYADNFPTALSFDADGNGYVLSTPAGGNSYENTVYLNRYVKDTFVSKTQITKY